MVKAVNVIFRWKRGTPVSVAGVVGRGYARGRAAALVGGGGGVPVNTSLPVISGTVQVGNTVSTSDGGWTNLPTGYAYQWQRSANGTTGWVDLSGATSANYVPLAADEGAYLRAGVRASNASGQAAGFAYSAASSQVSPGAALAPLPTFIVENWSASSSTGYLRLGMPFQKGAVPSGSRVRITRGGNSVAAQFDERTSWADGSLKFAVCHMRDAAFAGLESRTYQIETEPGAFDNAGSKTLTDATSAVDPMVDFTSLTQFNGSTTVTRASGAARARFATHATVATRVTKIHSGPVCEGWMVWGMANDGATGAGSADAHLKTIWYVDLWKNADGTIADVEYAAVVAQDWWAVANKFRLNYTATLKDGATTVQTYSGVQHPYHSQWATVRTAADNNHARRHWKTSIPTLLYKPSKAYWVASGLVPPLDTAFTPSATGSTNTYVPCGAMDHRPAIDAVGGYMGRGLIAGTDVTAFMRQTAVDFRDARMNALAGLHIPYHYRDDRTRTRPTESADVANTVMPLALAPKSAAEYTFTADGMAAPGYFSAHANTYLFDAPYASGITFVQPTGGTGVWFPSGDTTHAVNFSYFMYLHEGERYLMECVLDHAVNASLQQIGNANGSYLVATWSEEVWNGAPILGLNVPTTRWSGMTGIRGGGNNRRVGWALMLVGSAAVVVPENDVQRGFIRKFVQHQADYLAWDLSYTPAAMAQWGTRTHTGSGHIGPYFFNFEILGASFATQLAEHAGFKSYSDFVSRLVAGYWTSTYVDMTRDYGSAVSTIANRFSRTLTPYEKPLAFDIGAAINSGVVNANAGTNRPFRNGDLVYFFAVNLNDNSTPLPSGYTAGTPLYVVNATSGTSFQLAASPGGSPITYPNGSYTIAASIASTGDFAVQQNPSGGDSYAPIARAALIIAHRNGSPHTTAGKLAIADTYCSSINFNTDPRWKFAA